MFAKQVIAAVLLGAPIMLCNARPTFPSAVPDTITVTLPFSIPTGLPFNISLPFPIPPFPILTAASPAATGHVDRFQEANEESFPSAVPETITVTLPFSIPTGLPFNISLPTFPIAPFPILTAASPAATGHVSSIQGANDVINGLNEVNALVGGAQNSIVSPLSNNVNLVRNTVVPVGAPPNITELLAEIETLVGTGFTDLTSTITEITTELEQLGGLAKNITGIPTLPTMLQTTLGGMTSLANSITQVVGNVQSAVPGSALNNLDSSLFSNLQQAVHGLASGSSNAITNLQNAVPTQAGQQAVAEAWNQANGALSGSIRQLNTN